MVKDGPKYPQCGIGLTVAQGNGGGVAAAPNQIQLQIVDADFSLQRPAGLTDDGQ